MYLILNRCFIDLPFLIVKIACDKSRQSPSMLLHYELTECMVLVPLLLDIEQNWVAP